MVTFSAHSLPICKFVQIVPVGECSMAKLTLYHASPSRSSIVLWMLEELGQPYDIKLLSLKAGDNLKPDYLAINPMGKVPALKAGDTVITEAAAICTYLADEFPQAKMNIPIGDPHRGTSGGAARGGKGQGVGRQGGVTPLALQRTRLRLACSIRA